MTATLNLCLIYFKIVCALAILLEHMHKKFEINPTKIKGVCQSDRKVVTHNSKSDLPLNMYTNKAYEKVFEKYYLPVFESVGFRLLFPALLSSFGGGGAFRPFQAIFLYSFSTRASSKNKVRSLNGGDVK